MADDNGKTVTSTNQSRTIPSRRIFLWCALLLHASLTVVYFPNLGQTGGPSQDGIYAYFLVYTSMPTIFLPPLVPDWLNSSGVFLVCLVANGVLVVWLSANIVYRLIFGREAKG
ncbi:MAG: hypothetical protein ACK5PB_04480 [Pirellula sp.]